uniref:Ig-like domain-containing protein n=1 Tax=Anabas testudineus TaxID=64144 RepID=A0AAQ6IQN6_ANATE
MLFFSSMSLVMIAMLLLCEHDQKVNADSLHIGPNRAQFFEYESVTFYCEGVSYCEIVHESKGKLSSCNKTNKRTATGSSCTLTHVYTDDSGEFWFETGGGKRSNSVNIIVSAGSVILEIPALPVMEGEAVTLTCRNKTTSSQTSAHFYHYGGLIGNSSAGNMIIHGVSKPDEGIYKCNISGAGESAESRLIVGDGQKETVTSPFKETFSLISNPWFILTVLFGVLLMLVGLLYFVRSSCQRGKENKVSPLRPEPGSTGNQTGSESINSTTSATAIYAVVTKNRKETEIDESPHRSVYYVLGLDADSQQLEPSVIPPSTGTNPPLTGDTL